MHWKLTDDRRSRKFIVDAHKAAFVPVCIAATQGGAQSQMTAEPAVVVATTEDERQEMEDLENRKAHDKRRAFKNMHRDKTQQFGALNRRHLASGRNLAASVTHDPLGLSLSPSSQQTERASPRRRRRPQHLNSSPTAEEHRDEGSDDFVTTTSTSSPEDPNTGLDPAEKTGIESEKPGLAEETAIDTTSNEEDGIAVATPSPLYLPPEVESDIAGCESAEPDRERNEVEVQMARSTSPPTKVTRLGGYASETGEVRFDFTAGEPEKQKEE